jgi:hypothetical protein
MQTEYWQKRCNMWVGRGKGPKLLNNRILGFFAQKSEGNARTKKRLGYKRQL